MDIFECNTGAPGHRWSESVLPRVQADFGASAAVGSHREKLPMVSKEAETIDMKCKK